MPTRAALFELKNVTINVPDGAVVVVAQELNPDVVGKELQANKTKQNIRDIV